MNKETRLNDTELKIINLPNNPTKLIQYILRTRDKFLKSINYKRIPNPVTTTKVIYVMFNMSTQGPQAMYIGKTKFTAIERRRKHVYRAKLIKPPKIQQPITRFIQKVKPENIGIIPLMSVQNYNAYSHYYERLWIHKLQTHKKPKKWFQALNVSIEHKHYTKRQRTKASNNSLLTYIIPPSSPPTLYSHPYIRTINYLLSYDKFLQNTPPSLNNISNHKLFRILSILINKPSQFHKKPTKFLLQHKTISQNTKLHNTIKRLHPEQYITRLAKYVTDQIQANYDNRKPQDKAINIEKLDIFMLEHYASYIRSIPITHIINNNKHLLPPNIPKDTKFTIIYRNSKPTSRTLFNFKKATQQMPANLPPPNQCICNHPLLQSYIRQHQHIDTLDTSIITTLFPNDPIAIQYKQLMDKGTKYVETPHISVTQIMKRITQALNEYIERHENKQPSNQTDFTQWHITIQTQIIQYIQDHPPIQTQQPILSTQPARKITEYIHKHFVINLADKLPNNYSICCKNWWWHELKTTTLQNKLAYKQITNLKPAQIIQRQKEYLNKHHFPSYDKLPVKRISSKYHKDKPATRPLVSAPATTTTFFDKHLTMVLEAAIKSLKQEANLFEAKHGFTWFFDIENTQQVIDHIHKMNDRKPPETVITADADGFYDSIRPYWLVKLYRTEIPKIFKANHATFISTNIRNKTFKWTNKSTTHTKNIHCFTAKSVTKFLVWSLHNQYQLVGSHLVKQEIGVAQGSPHSGHQSRFLAICAERDFITQLVNQNRIDIAKKFADTIRKHDDIAFFNIPQNTIQQYFHIHAQSPGLYPWFIKPSWTNQQPYNTANYLNVTISIIENNTNDINRQIAKLNKKTNQQLRNILKKKKLRLNGRNKQTLIHRIISHTSKYPQYRNNTEIWTTKPYSKVQNFPIQLQQIANSFPNYFSNIPHHIKTGTVIGHLHTLFNTTSRIHSEFTKATTQFLIRLHKHNQYPIQILIKQVYRFLQRRETHFNVANRKLINTILSDIGKATNPNGRT
jgi:hypothetical protein